MEMLVLAEFIDGSNIEIVSFEIKMFFTRFKIKYRPSFDEIIFRQLFLIQIFVNNAGGDYGEYHRS